MLTVLLQDIHGGLQVRAGLETGSKHHLPVRWFATLVIFWRDGATNDLPQLLSRHQPSCHLFYPFFLIHTDTVIDPVDLGVSTNNSLFEPASLKISWDAIRKVSPNIKNRGFFHSRELAILQVMKFLVKGCYLKK